MLEEVCSNLSHLKRHQVLKHGQVKAKAKTKPQKRKESEQKETEDKPAEPAEDESTKASVSEKEDSGRDFDPAIMKGLIRRKISRIPRVSAKNKRKTKRVTLVEPTDMKKSDGM